MRIFIFYSASVFVCWYGITSAEEGERLSKQQLTFDDLTTSIVFRASFDDSTTANIGKGDKRIYTAESLERMSFSAQTFLFSLVSFSDWSPWLTLLLINRFLLTGVLPIFFDFKLS